MPYDQIGDFMKDLRGQEGISAQTLEFAILMAARTGEVIGARWEEFDLAKGVWTLPPDRMKAGKEHRVPISQAALAILENMKAISSSGYVFPGGKTARPLSNMAMLTPLRRMNRGDLTAHGFRSTFRDWAAECTAFPREVEAAYRRGDLFEKRRRRVLEWG